MRVYTSKRFDRNLQRLVKGDKLLTPKIKWVVGLRRHKLSGINQWSVSVNLSVRMIYRQIGGGIYLLDIGTHDDVY